jgi:drug/metabolite transporter (DMT)-like permease
MIGVAIGTKAPIRLDRRALGFVILLGLAQFCFNFNFVYRAEHYVTSGLVAVVFALLFVPNAMMARAFLGLRLSKPFLIGSAIATAGIALLFLNEARGDLGDQSATLTGIGFTFLGVISASTANVMQASDRAKSLPMASMLGWAMLSGAAIDGALAWATSGPPVVEWRLGYFAGLAYLGIVASALAFSLYFRMIRDIGPAKAAYSSVVVPVLAMALSTGLEGYRWTPLAVAGSLVAFAGMLIALSARKPST